MRSALKRWSFEPENRGFDPQTPTSPYGHGQTVNFAAVNQSEPRGDALRHTAQGGARRVRHGEKRSGKKPVMGACRRRQVSQGVGACCVVQAAEHRHHSASISVCRGQDRPGRPLAAWQARGARSTGGRQRLTRSERRCKASCLIQGPTGRLLLDLHRQ